MFHVVLVQPEIPPNTGNVIRLCANSGCTLHLVRPLGFELTRQAVRRAGLDYARARRGARACGLRACLEALCRRAPLQHRDRRQRALTARRHSPRGCARLRLRDPRPAAAGSRDRSRVRGSSRIPMRPGNRSLNLSNAVALVVYEAWRQNGFRTVLGALIARAGAASPAHRLRDPADCARRWRPWS